MDDFTLAQEELEATMKKLHQMVEACILAPTILDKKNVEMEARPTLREARSQLSALRQEARRTTDAHLRVQYDATCKIYDEKIRNFDSEMKRQVYPQQSNAATRPKSYEERRREELLGPGGADGTGFTDTAQVLQAATNVQQDALAAIERTERLQHVTEETGQKTLQTLQTQLEQMYHIDEELANVQTQIGRAARDVHWFYRQLAGDWCFVTLFGLCVLGLLALVFAVIYMKRVRKKK